MARAVKRSPDFQLSGHIAPRYPARPEALGHTGGSALAPIKPTSLESIAPRTRASKIAARLRRAYPSTKTALHHTDPFQLLIATILSAQCTDAQINKVTPALFARYPTPRALSTATQSHAERLIHSTGFFRSKARNIIACARFIVDHFHGEVPSSLEDLVTLPGVGRKTANVLLGAWWNIPGMVVDTHVRRLARLLGLTGQTDPEKIERELMVLLPAGEWNDFSMNLILHGRKICIARRPRCSECILNRLCPSARG